MMMDFSRNLDFFLRYMLHEITDLDALNSGLNWHAKPCRSKSFFQGVDTEQT